MGLQFLFMDDNAPCYHTVAAEQLLESRRLAARTLPPVTIRELRLALQDEWAAMPQQLIDTLILSMSRRCETFLEVREIISPTKGRMFLAGHPSQGCFGLQSHCAPCYFFNQASFYPSDFSFYIVTLSSSSLAQQPQMDLGLLQNIFPISSPCRYFLQVLYPHGFEISVNGVLPPKSWLSFSSITHRFMFEDLICCGLVVSKWQIYPM
ncbi:transposable element Tcb2 transposase [Trichonephila clavipes]|nr:transposable element Tcb2 transposase [Trichonephila clavipes]